MINHLPVRFLVTLLLWIVALGAVAELTQPFVRRSCSGWDVVADLVGIAAAWGMWKAVGGFAITVGRATVKP